jgi:uncharacterized protein (UPF0210 family)
MVAVARRVETACRDAGYLVQTTRLSPRPVFDDLAGWTAPEIVGYGRDLQGMLDRAGVGFCALGPAMAARPGFPLDRLDAIADLLVGAEALNCTVQLATTELGIRVCAAGPVARIMRRLANETDQGLGNFRFAMLACVDPGGPFFPAAYHHGPASISVGLQGAGIVAEALGAIDGLDLAAITDRVRQTRSRDSCSMSRRSRCGWKNRSQPGSFRFRGNAWKSARPSPRPTWSTPAFKLARHGSPRS